MITERLWSFLGSYSPFGDGLSSARSSRDFFPEVLNADKEYCCWTELGGVTISRSIHLTSVLLE